MLAVRLPSPLKIHSMLPAAVILCRRIFHQHLQSMAGLQFAAVAVVGQEIALMQHNVHIQHHPIADGSSSGADEDPSGFPAKDEQLVAIQLHGQEAMRKALEILEDSEGWTTETEEANGDVISSKVVPGARRVFKLEATLEAGVEELYDILFLKVEEMHQWNPSIQPIKVLKHVGPATVVTHVSARMEGILIGQRDFLSVRHSCRRNACIYLASAAIQLESFPPQRGILRAEDGPTCIIVEPVGNDSRRSRLTWLLNIDVKGWLPNSIVNQVLPQTQLDFTRHLRRRLTAGEHTRVAVAD